ncbi:MAG: Gfo/Idh/MocA family oxidoreductase, partial [Gemmatimonadetes bacterium]|nr:Gfo/Idh/MocA family oxidoreductase [Gemmatimonadota bacterium]
ADAWKEMLRRDDIDLVLIATPWEDHVEMSVYAMQQGKHVGLEVPAAYTVEDCWKLVDTAEATQRNCIMLENVCYGEEELWLLNMAANGVFGTLTYAECAYIHDLRELLYSKDYYYNQWRIRHNEARDGNLYPTHGLGPVAQYMDIDRGDRFEHLVSMSSMQAGLDEYARNVEPDNEFYNRSGYRHGDMNNTLIKTHLGRTILVQHDVVTGRPYSRINMLAGTKAFHNGYPSRMSMSGKGHGWLSKEDYQTYRERFTHPLWAKLKKEAETNGGHGGMDFVMLYRLIDCLNRGLPLDMDVYDAASWS